MRNFVPANDKTGIIAVQPMQAVQHLFYCPLIADTHVLSEEESAHAIRVLRRTTGDMLHIADGKGMLYEAQITNPHPKHCEVAIVEQVQQAKHHPVQLHIAVAPTKNIERIEWLAEKCTEIGVDTLTPLLCRYSERKQIRVDRLEKIVLAAAKQSLSAYLPELHEMTPVEQVICSATEQRRYIAHSSPWTDKKVLRDELRNTPTASTIVLIGAEGGFTDEEVRMAMEHGFVPVSLGDARLRTETAAVVATTLVQNID